MKTKAKSKRLKLYEITIEQYKVFYVEAKSQEDALKSGPVTDEFYSGEVAWEHSGTRAEKICSDQATHIRMYNGHLILRGTP